MANIKSIGGNPIVPASVEEGAITGAMIADNTIPDAKLVQTGGVLSLVNDLRSAVVDGSSIYPELGLIRGAIDGGTGAIVGSNTDLVTKDIIYGNGVYTVKPNGQKTYVVHYRADGTAIGGDGNWGKTSDFTLTISNGNGFRIATRNSDGSVLPLDGNLLTLSLSTAVENANKAFQPYSLCKMVSHQGYPLGSDTTGHCLASQYIKSAEHGFTVVEGDLKFTSDNVPVLCHDWSFTDSVSGDSVTIANVTYSQLITHKYYGSTMSSLDEVIGICKQYGLDFVLDHFPAADTATKREAVFSVIKKHRMEDNVIFNVYTTDAGALSDALYQWYPKARLIVNCSAHTYVDDAISIVNAYSSAGKFGELIVGTTYSNGLDNSVALMQRINDETNLGVKTEIWTSDVMDWILPFLPYVDYYVSNKVSNKTLITG